VIGLIGFPKIELPPCPPADVNATPAIPPAPTVIGYAVAPQID
jgi:hypothetical protein